MQLDMFSLRTLLSFPALQPISVFDSQRCDSYACGFTCSIMRKACHLNHAMTIFEDAHTMARKKATGKPDYSPVQFVRCELTADERKDLPRFIKASDGELDTLVVEILQSNHKIGFSFSDHNDSFIVSVTGRPEECLNASKCYTSHGKDYLTALWVALYKFHVIWKQGVWEETETDSDFG